MENLLKIDNICFTIGVNTGGIKVSALLDEGGVLNICGPSGSGKTTLLRILARLKETGGGSIFLQGKPWTDFSPAGWRRKVYYLAQKPAIFDGTVEENLKKPFELAAVKSDLRFDLDRAARLMERLYLPQELLTRDARTLSGGESSRVALVRALLIEPSVLLLDEPLAALDRTAASAVIELIAEWLQETGGRGAALVSHTGDIGGLSCCSVLDLGGKEGDLSE